MADKDIALGLLQSAVAIAGLVLVYVAFIISRSANLENTKRSKKFTRIAVSGIIPVILALLCALLSVRVLLCSRFGSQWAVYHLIPLFEILLVLTGIYAIISAFLLT